MLEKIQAVLEIWFYLLLLSILERFKSFHFFAQKFWVLWKIPYDIKEICAVWKFLTLSSNFGQNIKVGKNHYYQKSQAKRKIIQKKSKLTKIWGNLQKTWQNVLNMLENLGNLIQVAQQISSHFAPCKCFFTWKKICWWERD
jgi:hypothetical protein